MVDSVKSQTPVLANMTNSQNKPADIIKQAVTSSNELAKDTVHISKNDDDKKLNNKNKLLITAGSAVALVSVGIAGYKGKLGKTLQNWLGGAEKAAEDLSSKGKKELDDVVDGINTKVDEVLDEGTKGTDSKLEKAVDDVNPKVDEALDEGKKGSTTKTENAVDELLKFEKKEVKRADGTLFSIQYYDKSTKKLVKSSDYYDDGKTISKVLDYNEAGEVVKLTGYREDGKTIKCVSNFNAAGLFKSTDYYDDGKTIKRVYDFNDAKKLVKSTDYYDDGKTINKVRDFNDAGKIVKSTEYYADGETIKTVRDYNDAEELVKTTRFDKSGNIIS